MHHQPPHNLPVVDDDLTPFERVLRVNPEFTEEGIKNFLQLAELLRNVVNRLHAEGYRFDGERLIPPEPPERDS